MRSLLLVPCDAFPDLDAVLGAGADALVLDLAGSVPLSGGGGARGTAASFLRAAAGRSPRPLIFVRVNGFGTGSTDADLGAVMRAAPDGIVLPKAEGAADVQRLAAKLAVAEAEHGLPPGRTRIVPVATDTAKGVLASGSIPGSSPRLAGLAWGGADWGGADRGGARRPAAPALHARTMVVVAAAAAEVDAIDAALPDGRDPGGFARACRRARRDGFASKMAIHPAQVALINALFGPTAPAA